MALKEFLDGQAKVDEDRAGALRIDVMVLRELLGLGPEYEVVSARSEPFGHTITLEILGGDLPQRVEGVADRDVRLICYTTLADDGTKTIEAAWAHLPDKRWRLR